MIIFYSIKVDIMKNSGSQPVCSRKPPADGLLSKNADHFRF